MKRTILGSASFAHLFGRGPKAGGARVEEDEDMDDKKARKKGETDEQYAKRMEEEDESDSDDKGKNKDARAEDGDDEEGEDEDEVDSDDEDGDEGEGDDEEDDAKKRRDARKAKRAKSESEKKDDEGADDDDAAEKHGRKAERARWTKVLSSAASADRGETAITFLSTTNMSAALIVGLLKTTPAASASAKSRRLDERMNTVHQPNVGGNGGGSGKAPTVAQQIVLAGKKRRGEA